MARTTKTSKTDTYKMVTDKILAQLNQGIIPWEKPWFGSHNRAYNRVTNKDYSFMNQMLVGQGGEYASYNQWTSAGARVKKGEKASQVFFWKMYEVEKTDKVTGEKHIDKIPVLRYFNVFHISQVEPIFEDKPIIPVRNESEEDMMNPDDRIIAGDEIIEQYMKREGITFKEVESDSAYYSPQLDCICVPKYEQFKNGPEYYSTTFHEMTHSTGHPKRLNRNMTGKFGSTNYSHEELIAEIGSALLLADSRIATEHTERNNIAYIQSWISFFSKEGNEKIFVKAAGAAEKAAKFIVNEQKAQNVVEESKESDTKPTEEKPEVTNEAIDETVTEQKSEQNAEDKTEIKAEEKSESKVEDKAEVQVKADVVEDPMAEESPVSEAAEGKDVVVEPAKKRARKAAPKKGTKTTTRKKKVPVVQEQLSIKDEVVRVNA